MSVPSTSDAFRRALDQAITTAEARKASKDTCPHCRRPLALLILSFRGLKVGYLCRKCPGTSFDELPKKPKDPKPKKTGAARKTGSKREIAPGRKR